MRKYRTLCQVLDIPAFNHQISPTFFFTKKTPWLTTANLIARLTDSCSDQWGGTKFIYVKPLVNLIFISVKYISLLFKMKIRAERNKQTNQTASQPVSQIPNQDRQTGSAVSDVGLAIRIGWLAGWLKQKRLTIKINLNIYQETKKKTNSNNNHFGS